MCFVYVYVYVYDAIRIEDFELFKYDKFIERTNTAHAESKKKQ